MSCLEEKGMTPDRLVSPTVGFIPTTEFSDAGQSMESIFSVPSVAASAIDEPVLEPHRFAEST